MSGVDWHRPLEDEPGFHEALSLVAHADAPDSAWETLSDRLVHQYDIDDIAIKALPLFVVMAKRLPPTARYRHLAWIGSIAYCSQLPGSRWVLESAPSDVQQSFIAALEQSVTLIAESLLEHWDLYETKDLLLAYAAVRGNTRLADHLDRYEVLLTCPKCENMFEAPSSVGT